MATSKGYTATATGTDYWVATYNGDGNNNSVTSPARQRAGVGQPGQPDHHHDHLGARNQFGVFTLKDSATLAGGFNQTGTITFTLYDPGGTVVDTEMVDGQAATAPTPRRPATRCPPPARSPAPTSGSPATAATATTTRVASTKGDEPVVVASASPDDQHDRQPVDVTLDNTGSPTLKDSATLRRLPRDRNDHLQAVRPEQHCRGHRDRDRSAATAPTPRRPATRCPPRAR